MNSVISEESFNTIKDIVRKLRKEVAYDKAHDIDLFTVTDFNGYNGIDGLKLAHEIDKNPDIKAAANLQIARLEDDNVLVITYADEDIRDTGSFLTVDRLLNIIDKLVKMGRKGIAERKQKVPALHKQVRALKDQIGSIELKLDVY